MVYWSIFNTKSFPFHYAKIRRALAECIDLDRLHKIVQVKPALSPLPPRHSQIIEAKVNSRADLQESFRKILKELELCLSDFPVINLIYLTGSIRDQVAEFIKKEWETHLGIQCRTEPLEWNSLFNRLIKGDFQMGNMAWEASVNDPIYTLNAFRNGSDHINFSNGEHKRYQHILSLAEREVDLQKR